MSEKDLYASLKSEELDRAEEVDEGDISVNAPKSASEQESFSPNDSDLITTLKRLFPQFKVDHINEILQYLMVARVFPDTYLDKKYLTVISFKRKHPEVPIYDLENIVDTAMSIGFNGKSRVEILLVQGSAREAAESETEKGGSF